MKSSVAKSPLRLDSVVSAAKDQVSGDLGEEAVILSLQDGMYYGVNSVGMHIWSRLQRPVRVAEIIESLLDEFEIEREACVNDVQGFLVQLHSKGLIEIVEQSKS